MQFKEAARILKIPPHKLMSVIKTRVAAKNEESHGQVISVNLNNLDDTDLEMLTS